MQRSRKQRDGLKFSCASFCLIGVQSVEEIPRQKLQLVQFAKGKEKDRQMDRLIDAMCQVDKSLFLPSTVFPRSLVLLRHRKIFLFKEEGVANGFKMSEIQSDSVIKLVNTLLCSE